MNLSTMRTSQNIACHTRRGLLVAVAIFGTACSGTCGSAQPSAGTSTTVVNGPLVSSSVANIIAPTTEPRQFAAMVNLVLESAASIPRTGFDPAALAVAEGNDPRRLFLWVRDRTWWVPYRGVLRGPTGVMLDRVGNSLDRSFLLGDLLRRTGRVVRLAHADLSAANARDLLPRLRKLPDQRQERLAANPDEANRVLKTAEAIVPGTGKFRSEIQAVVRQRVANAKTLIRDQSRQLKTALGSSEIKTDDELAIASLRDHWWVEYLDEGKWVAMDPLLPDSNAGDSNAAPSQAVEWPEGAKAPSLLADQWQQVTLKVVVERYEHGSRTEATLLETAVRPGEIVGQEATLIHFPTPFAQDGLLTRKTDPAALKAAALGVREWRPILKVGGRQVVGAAFTEKGEIKSGKDDPIKGAGGAGVMGGLDSALGGGDEGEGQVTAEWVDYEIRVPGRQPERVRRPVFDLLGPARRAAELKDFDATTEERRLERAGLLLGQTTILLQPCDFTPEFVTFQRAATLLANRAALLEFAAERDRTRARQLALKLLEKSPHLGPLPYLALWRSALKPAPGDVFIDRPNILTHRAALPMSQGHELEVREWIDIASNGVAIRRGTLRDWLEIRVEQGIVDTLAEAMAIGSDPGFSHNTASVFALASAQSHSARLIKGRSDLQGLEWSAEALSRLSDDLSPGFVALAPTRMIALDGRQRAGWWLVHAPSGDTIGVMDTGYRQDMPERAAGESELAYSARLLDWARNNPNYIANQMTRNGTGAMSESINLEIIEQFMGRIAADLFDYAIAFGL